MTKRLFSFVAGAALLAAVAPLSIAVSAAEITCRIPFSFVVNGATLPSGAYSIASSGGVVMLKGADKSALVMTRLADDRHDQTGKSKVVFLKTGDRYDLIEIWTSDGVGREVPKTRKSVEERARSANLRIERIVVLGN